jgi:hypothetical protein
MHIFNSAEIQMSAQYKIIYILDTSPFRCPQMASWWTVSAEESSARVRALWSFLAMFHPTIATSGPEQAQFNLLYWTCADMKNGRSLVLWEFQISMLKINWSTACNRSNLHRGVVSVCVASRRNIPVVAASSQSTVYSEAVSLLYAVSVRCDIVSEYDC